ncbi:unnamed protein product [Caenorhabditis auriculariae]|uniref:G protein-coupled receptor n=1 Tax=Caenorhabditis auriculariae TaxID=2777116 RepID=A0A8S1HAE6_9PELO|nr:unnamed protein product [Caenorhabditis auriculariae]
MTVDRPYTVAFSVYYSIYFCTAVIAQVVLLVLLKTATPKNMMKMRSFLIVSSLGHVFVCTVAFLTQARTLNTPNTLALLCNGACKYFSPELCFVNYGLQLSMSNFVGLVNIHMMYYRYVLLDFSKESFRWVAGFSAIYLSPAFILVILFFPPPDFEVVREETYRLHPEYDLSVYEKFPGFSNSHHPNRNLVNFVLAAESVILPIRAGFWMRSAVSKLNPLSRRTQMQMKSFIRGLTIQILTPLIFYATSGSSHLVSKYAGL